MKNVLYSLICSLIFVSACSTFSEESLEQALVDFPAYQFEFDTLQVGDTLRHEFRFTNIGEADLIIDTVSSNCDCALGYFPNNPVKPGQTDRIEVSFSPQESGYATRRYVVRTNTDSVFHVLTLQGYVE